MSGGFEVDYGLVNRTADAIDATRARLDEATTRVQTTVDGTGNPWGDDQQGSAFGQVYSTTLGHVLDVMRTHSDQLDYAAQSLRLSAEDHRTNDDNVRVTFEGLGEGL